MAASTTVGRFFSFLMGPNLLAIIFGTILALALPILVHYFLYRPRTEPGLPTFLLVGPSGSGKTTLLTYLERGGRVATHTSQAPLSVEVTLPTDIITASSRYRSSNDPTSTGPRSLLLIDTPGHGKLRYFALDRLAEQNKIKGIIFVVDAADLSEAGPEDRLRGGLRETAEYLHDVLLLLQRHASKARSSRGFQAVPVLVAANKLDLFTALPTPLVKTRLEGEITKIRESRARGLLDSGIGMESATDIGDEKDWLGERDEAQFRFSQLADLDVPVHVAGGNAMGPDGSDVKQWWEWLADQL